MSEAEKEPLIQRLTQAVIAIQNTNKSIWETVERLNGSIGHLIIQEGNKGKESPKETAGDFEVLETLLKNLAADQRVCAKQLEDFTIRVLGPRTASKV